MNDDMMISIVAITMPLLLVSTIMLLKHRARKREWQHQERMRAMDLGLPIPNGDIWPALTAIAIGAGVPVGSMFWAFVANAGSHDAHGAWPCAMMVGMAGVIGGTKLAGRLLPPRRQPDDASHLANGKPRFDPDAYDVVGRRG